MADLFVDGAVGAGMGEVLRLARETINNGLEFRPSLERNMGTLDTLAPLVKEIIRYNNELGRPREEVETLESEMRLGAALVSKFSKLPWWKFICFPCYQQELLARDQSLVRHLSVDTQAKMRRDSMETLSKVGDILEILIKENIGQHQGNQIMDLSEAPEELKSKYIVGKDELFRKLKIKLLKYGASDLVLTGFAGSGKSTLAKMLCSDRQIRGKFREKIFFVTVSETANLKTIIQTIFELSRSQVPECQSDEDAINQLGLLLREVGTHPILLVLDDVRPSSEALVIKLKFQMLKFQISNYKILVTSRVALLTFGATCHFELETLGHDDAISLFCHFAQLNVSNSYVPGDDLVHEIVRSCKGSPKELEFIGESLCQQPFEVWQNMKARLQIQPTLESGSPDLHCYLQQSLDALEDKFSINEQECSIDLGLFPEDQSIPVAVLIDIWAELYNLDEDGRNAMVIVHDLTTRNLIDVIVRRKVAMGADIHYNNHFVAQHNLLRELAIHQSNQEPFEQRKRLIIDLNGHDRPKWGVGQNQQGIMGRISSFSLKRLIGQKQLRITARIVSITTDETFTSDWCDMQPDEAEVLVLNLCSSRYTLPKFTKKMCKLKVLIVTNYGIRRSELKKFELLGSLSDLKRIRLEKVSVPCLCILKNLRKLSLHMCDTRQAFESCSIQISDAMPNLVEMSIDYCSELEKLPDGLCNITPLKKLSITNCHKLSTLPREIAKLKNLEVLRLSSCSHLLMLADSVGGLHKLRCLDISDCVSLTKLPDDIGHLHNLEKVYMWRCSSLSELPSSVMNFKHLKHEIYVICDEERGTLWEYFRSIPNLNIEMSEVNLSLNWLH